jgi:hypothetical protein
MPDKRNRKIKDRKSKGGSKIAPPETRPSIPPEQQPPVFALQYLHQDYCVTQCETNDQASFSVQLKKLSSMTWKEIQSAPRHGLGYEKIDHDAIKASIPSHITKDVTLIAFRFSGKKSMVGYRDGRTFYVIWLDRNFSLYNHGS